MTKCQNCKTEYQSNEFNCPKCGNENTTLRNSWIHLTTVSNDIEFEIITGLLHIGNIPSLRKPLGDDEIVGIPVSGIEIMIPKDRYHEAIQLLDTQDDEEVFEEEKKAGVKYVSTVEEKV